jgi:hypothetical protein
VLTGLQGTAEQGNATTGLKYGPIRSETAAGQNNVTHPALGDKSKTYTVCLKSKCTDFPMDELEM